MLPQHKIPEEKKSEVTPLFSQDEVDELFNFTLAHSTDVFWRYFLDHAWVDLDRKENIEKFFTTAMQKEGLDAIQFLLRCYKPQEHKEENEEIESKIISGPMLPEEYSIRSIFSMVENGCLDKLRHFVEMAFDLNIQNEKNETPLIVAVKKGRLDIVKFLVEEAKVDLKPKIGPHSAVTFALSNKDKEIIKYFLAIKKSSPKEVSNFISQEIVKVFLGKVRKGDLSAVKFIFENAEPDLHAKSTDNVGDNVLMIAIKSQNLELVKYIFEIFHEKINFFEKDNRGLVAIDYAACGSDLSILKCLLEYQATLLKNEAKSDEFKENNNLILIERLVCHAVTRNQLTTVKYLEQEFKPSFNSVYGSNKSNLLMYAALFDALDCAKYLVEEKKIDIFTLNKEGNTAFIVSVSKGSRNVFKYLLECHLKKQNKIEFFESLPTKKLNIATASLFLLLHDPRSREKSLDIFECLFGLFEEVYSPSTTLAMILDYAAQGGRSNLVKFLIDAPGANYLSAINLALKNNHLKSASLIIQQRNLSLKDVVITATQAGSKVFVQTYLEESKESAEVKLLIIGQAIYEAIKSANIELLNYFLNFIKKEDLLSYFHFAIQNNSLESVKFFLQDVQMDIWLKNKEEKNALMLAIEGKNVIMVDFLFQQARLAAYKKQKQVKNQDQIKEIASCCCKLLMKDFSGEVEKIKFLINQPSILSHAEINQLIQAKIEQGKMGLLKQIIDFSMISLMNEKTIQALLDFAKIARDYNFYSNIYSMIMRDPKKSAEIAKRLHDHPEQFRAMEQVIKKYLIRKAYKVVFDEKEIDIPLQSRKFLRQLQTPAIDFTQLSQQRRKLECAFRELERTLLGLKYKLISATNREIQGDALLSHYSQMRAGLTYSKSTDGERPKEEKRYVFAYVRAGSAPPTKFLSEYAKLKIYQWDLAAAKPYLFAKKHDPYVYEKNACLYSYMIGNVHLSERSYSNNDHTQLKVVGKNGETKVVTVSKIRGVVEGVFIEKAIAGLVLERLRLVAEIDIDSAWQVVSPFLDAKAVEGQKEALAEKLVNNLTLLEASIPYRLPFSRFSHRLEQKAEQKNDQSLKQIQIINHSDLRDDAMKLQTAIAEGDKDRVVELIQANEYILDLPPSEDLGVLPRSVLIWLDKSLLNYNCSVNDFTPLGFAVVKNRLEIVKLLVNEFKADLEARSLIPDNDLNICYPSGMTPLMLAAEQGHFEMVKFFVEAGANLAAVKNYFESGSNENVLTIAKKQGDSQIINYLISHGAREYDGSIPHQRPVAALESKEVKKDFNNEKALAEINALTRLLCEADPKNPSACSVGLRNDWLIFNFKTSHDSRLNGVDSSKISIIPFVLGAKDHYLGLETRSRGWNKYYVKLGFSCKDGFWDDHDKFDSLAEVRDRLLSRALEDLLACAQNEEYYFKSKKRSAKSIPGVTNRRQLSSSRLHRYQIEVITQSTELVLMKVTHSKYLNEIKRVLCNKLIMNDEKLIEINTDNTIKIYLAPDQLIQMLQDHRVNYQGCVIHDSKGNIAMANRKDYWNDFDLGFSGPGGHCSTPYAPKISMLKELESEFNLVLKESKEDNEINRLQLLNKTNDCCVWMISMDELQPTPIAKQFQVSFFKPFEACKEEFVRLSEVFFSFERLRKGDIFLRNLDSVEYYLQYEEKRINDALSNQSEFDKLRVKISTETKLVEAWKIKKRKPSKDFGVVVIAGDPEQLNVLKAYLLNSDLKLIQDKENLIIESNPLLVFECVRNLGLRPAARMGLC